MNFRVGVWAVVLSCLFVSWPAVAGAINPPLITGTILTGIDIDGIFGPKNADLSGVPITIQYSWIFGGPYGLNYSSYYSGYVGRQAAISQRITVNGVSLRALGDNYVASGFTGVNTSGEPETNSLRAFVGGYCDGRFALLAELECQEEIDTNYSFGAIVAGSVLTESDATELFSHITGGTMRIHPFLVPYAHPGDPGAETFTFSTVPEPATPFLMPGGAVTIFALRRRRSRQLTSY